jgi:hypothetical protein
MTDQQDVRERDEWRVEVKLEADADGSSLGEKLHSLELDNDARDRLGGSVIVTRDGPHVFLYAWHQESAREAERVVRELMDEMGLAGQVELMRWHPIADQWRPASEPLPQDSAAIAAEEAVAERTGQEEGAAGDFPWQVVIDLPHITDTRDLAKQLERRGLDVKRRFKYLLVGAASEETAIELGESLEGNVPEGSHVSVRANPRDRPQPSFVWLENLKPGILRDLGL